jgi:hypothetical protein
MRNLAVSRAAGNDEISRYARNDKGFGFGAVGLRASGVDALVQTASLNEIAFRGSGWV